MGINKVITVLLVVGVLAGCATKTPEPSGFLPDYAVLTESPSESGAMVWKKPGVSPNDYDSVVIEPVQMTFDRSDEKYEDLDHIELDMLAVYGRKVLTATLSEKYEVVKGAGPRTLVVRAVIADVEPSVPAMNVVSSVMPVGILISYGREAITGRHSWVGAVQYEIQFVDGGTGLPVAMLVHNKAGEKWDLEGITDDLGHVRSQFDHLAENMRKELWYFADPE